MGTPHHGSDLASWAKFGTNIAGIVCPVNKDILAVLEPGSEVLDQVQGSFHNLLRMRKDENREIAITCFWEKLGVTGRGQVPALRSCRCDYEIGSDCPTDRSRAFRQNTWLRMLRYNGKSHGMPHLYLQYGHANSVQDMTKFPDKSDPGYDLVFGELLRWNKTAMGAQGSTTRVCL
jgi:hypothetical protein